MVILLYIRKLHIANIYLKYPQLRRTIISKPWSLTCWNPNLAIICMPLTASIKSKCLEHNMWLITWCKATFACECQIEDSFCSNHSNEEDKEATKKMKNGLDERWLMFYNVSWWKYRVLDDMIKGNQRGKRECKCWGRDWQVRVFFCFCVLFFCFFVCFCCFFLTGYSVLHDRLSSIVPRS